MDVADVKLRSVFFSGKHAGEEGVTIIDWEMLNMRESVIV